MHVLEPFRLATFALGFLGSCKPGWSPYVIQQLLPVGRTCNEPELISLEVSKNLSFVKLASFKYELISLVQKLGGYSYELAPRDDYSTIKKLLAVVTNPAIIGIPTNEDLMVDSSDLLEIVNKIDGKSKRQKLVEFLRSTEEALSVEMEGANLLLENVKQSVGANGQKILLKAPVIETIKKAIEGYSRLLKNLADIRQSLVDCRYVDLGSMRRRLKHFVKPSSTAQYIKLLLEQPMNYIEKIISEDDSLRSSLKFARRSLNEFQAQIDGALGWMAAWEDPISKVRQIFINGKEEAVLENLAKVYDYIGSLKNAEYSLLDPEIQDEIKRSLETLKPPKGSKINLFLNESPSSHPKVSIKEVRTEIKYLISIWKQVSKLPRTLFEFNDLKGVNLNFLSRTHTHRSSWWTFNSLTYVNFSNLLFDLSFVLKGNEQGDFLRDVFVKIRDLYIVQFHDDVGERVYCDSNVEMTSFVIVFYMYFWKIPLKFRQVLIEQNWQILSDIINFCLDATNFFSTREEDTLRKFIRSRSFSNHVEAAKKFDILVKILDDFITRESCNDYGLVLKRILVEENFKWNGSLTLFTMKNPFARFYYFHLHRQLQEKANKLKLTIHIQATEIKTFLAGLINEFPEGAAMEMREFNLFCEMIKAFPGVQWDGSEEIMLSGARLLDLLPEDNADRDRLDEFGAQLTNWSTLMKQII